MAVPYEAVASPKDMRNKDVVEVIESVVRLYKASWEAFKLNWLTFVLLMLVPTAMALVAVPLVILPMFTGSDAGILLGSLMLLVVLAITLLFAPSLTVTSFESAHGRTIDFEGAFNQSKPFVVRYVLLSLVIGILVVLGLILFVIPGLIAIFFLSAAPYLLVAKNLSIRASLRQSIDLTKIYWKPVLGLVFISACTGALGGIPFIGTFIAFAVQIVFYCAPAMIVTRVVEATKK